MKELAQWQPERGFHFDQNIGRWKHAANFDDCGNGRIARKKLFANTAVKWKVVQVFEVLNQFENI
jgi:predicted acetyltransferase